ncbi:hypothetical protein C5167_009362 [Papaver somniferum]|uniref:Bromo domain-containing protein n=1 Tax=Papaver somniferum TaxID=3469 RepID=A0A4Y7JX72_PAPSO|nr:bromodomain-containing protein 9-like [Papaver somniferum]RZC65673.1 hypothetical protein C5167_009362 [Papaver somniferum]
MGKITKRKKKGRPPKADLSTPRRSKVTDPPPESALRRSVRSRNLPYSDDQFYDDIEGEEEEDSEDEEEEEEKRRKKKMKLVMRLASSGQTKVDSSLLTRNNETTTPAPAPDSAASASSSDDGDDSKPFKKRRINGDDEEDANANVDEEVRSDDQRKDGRQEKKDTRRSESLSGFEGNYSNGIPLPDKKEIDLIMDKLQKKDTYGVYAEPVDTEELPDYLEMIENPMDFGTIRKNLEKGTYTKLEQLEADVFLLCSNAMEYNSPDTVYFKQARSIQELARKKFHRLKVNYKRSEAEIKIDQTKRSNVVVKKSTKKTPCKVVQEPVGSDFSAGVTLTTRANLVNQSNTVHAGSYGVPGNYIGFGDRNSFLLEHKSEKAEEQVSGKGLQSKFGKKPIVLDDDRRATYGMTSQHLVNEDSTFTIFEGDTSQLVAVGLHTDHCYARSLARFAATLGPAAWKVASRRIEQVLPGDFRFGRGWVGEYEPLPTSILVLENSMPKELSINSHKTEDIKKDDQIVEESLKAKQNVTLGRETVNLPRVSCASISEEFARERHFGYPMSNGLNSGVVSVSGPKPVVNVIGQQQNPQVSSNVLKQVDMHSSSSFRKDHMNVAPREKPMNNSHMTIPRLQEMDSRNRVLSQSASFSHPVSNGIVVGGLPNVNNCASSHRATSFSSDVVPSKQVRLPAFPHGNHEQGLSDPVQMLRMMANKTHNQQNSANHPMAEAIQSIRDDAVAVATPPQAWMALGYANPARERQSDSQVHFETAASGGFQTQTNKNRFPQAFLLQAMRIGENNRPVFSQQQRMMDTKFHVQSPQQGLGPQTQTNSKQDTLPPDLNIGFPSSGSPVRLSSGVLLDSQLPDLALQL